MDIKKLVDGYQSFSDKEVMIEGWIRNNRSQKELGFIEMFDGTVFGSVQVVYNNTLADFDVVSKFRAGCAIEVHGKVVLTPELKQPFELLATKVILHADSDEDYPIQPKRHTREFLREKGHLRARTQLFNTVFRVRNELQYAVHKFFQEDGFIHCPAPIITNNDAEGAGEMFSVSSFDFDNLPRTESGAIDYSKDFFSSKTNLTVTGQLEAEIYALSFKKTYTFGPTFRAENSNTNKHAAEFWMIEPEIAFADNSDNMELAERFVKSVVGHVLEKCSKELEWLDSFVENGLVEKLQLLIGEKFERISYTDAIEILLNADKEFENEVAWGNDLATEHEKYITDVHFKKAVFVTDWPKEIKAFYMRLNEDGNTVAGMDLLVPRVGELIGGSQREERYDHLVARMDEMNIPHECLWWYLELRKYGGCYHSGFGLGFERLVMFVTGVENIRDAHPFPRTTRNCEF